MARYTEAVVAALRQRYENTDQLMTSIAAEFGIGLRTLGRMALTQGWRKRSLRTRGLPIAVRLLEEAKGLAARETPPTPNPSPPLASLAEGGELSPIDRLEALVVKEIDAEEAAHAQRRGKHSVAKTSERNARTLATLTQTLRTLQRLRAGDSPEHENFNDDYDDMPRDLDEFRRDLARRIDAFVASRTDGNDAGGNAEPQPVDGVR
jgi:hypothetical protein